MKRIALTGGIGVGKTYISQQFIDIGIPVFNMDVEAKKIYATKEYIEFIRNEFGDELVVNDEVSIPKLGELLFKDKISRNKVQKYVHPIIMKMFNDWCNPVDDLRHEVEYPPFVICECAILYEAGLEQYFDKVWVVDTPFKTRFERIKKRNPNLSETDILRRINAQMPQEKKVGAADLIISNP